ncbi:MAG: ATP phosphoribosyltransferase [Dehalococcoidales bacterium]|nr:MAG: ATP phosphoribosyltransferase [Dehalococcoidales bacterium]
MSNLKIALPKGRLLADTADLLDRAEWAIDGYVEGARSYRLNSGRFPGLLAKIFHEKDIPIQVAVGNYDLGICGLDWVEELTSKFPSVDIIELRNLGYGEGTLYMAAGRSGSMTDVKTMREADTIIRMVSEYPNMAESFALKNRLRRFSVFSLWGAAGAYPPESAELALIREGEEVPDSHLMPVQNILDFNAGLIANRNSWEKEDLSVLLASIDKALRTGTKSTPSAETKTEVITTRYSGKNSDKGIIKLALPDGHAQKHTVELLDRAGVKVLDYPSVTENRRPETDLEGVSIKVIRPQDMPLQVANGNFDLAITGKDWVLDHLYQFPSSPVMELLDLKSSWVKIVAVIDDQLPVNDLQGFTDYFTERSLPIRVASEYVNIADKCARENHMGLYRMIPTWGATEVFLPEDADLLIENTETGGTIARHNLKIIDTLFESTARLIGNKNSITCEEKGDRIKSIVKILKKGIKE